jgi:hypothetical protein
MLAQQRFILAIQYSTPKVQSLTLQANPMPPHSHPVEASVTSMINLTTKRKLWLLISLTMTPGTNTIKGVTTSVQMVVSTIASVEGKAIIYFIMGVMANIKQIPRCSGKRR